MIRARRRLGAACLGTFLALAGLPVMADPLQNLDAARWKKRVLVVLAARPDDPLLTAQRNVFAAMGEGAKSRDLVLVEAIGEEAERLRKRLQAEPMARVLLVGKDGGVKLSSGSALGAEALYPVIDDMPMRREEMRRRGS